MRPLPMPLVGGLALALPWAPAWAAQAEPGLAQVAGPGLAQEVRVRPRALGFPLAGQPGPHNAITDVPGVLVGHATRVRGLGPLVPGVGPVRTGVTAIVPGPDPWRHKRFAGVEVLNGNGEMTAAAWVQEAGWLETPILLTDTLSVGQVSAGYVRWMAERYPTMGAGDDVVLPLVAECDDGWLNDQRGMHNGLAEVREALDGASAGPVAGGCVGAGTGMNAYRFKGGIGSSSRILPASEGGWRVGVLVNANMGRREDLRLPGIPPALLQAAAQCNGQPREGSIIMVLATNAPLLPHQLRRMAKRMGLGLARTGSPARHGSGDFMLAFSTAAALPHEPEGLTLPLLSVPNQRLDPLFIAAADAAEEAILDALCQAVTTEGRDGHRSPSLPLAPLRAALRAR